MRLTHETIDVQVKLHELDLLKLSREVAREIQEGDRAKLDAEVVKLELKEKEARAKMRIQSSEAKVATLLRTIGQGFEIRKMDCAIVYRWIDKEKDWIRPDTLEVVKTDIISGTDLQEEARLEAKREEEALKEAVKPDAGPATQTIGEALEAQGVTAEDLKTDAEEAPVPDPEDPGPVDESDA